MQHPQRPSDVRLGPVLPLVVAMLAVVGLGACASPPPTSANEIATARFAIRDARANGAETYAAAELQQAIALLEQARDLPVPEAERLAERATAHAQLATVIAARDGARRRLAEAQRISREAQALQERTTDAVEPGR